MAVGLLALFVALGGSSYAAITLKKNSVKSIHIKNGQVKKADLGAGAVDASKVANGGLLAEDFAAGQLPSGPQGPKGDAGAKGDAGTNGQDGADGTDGTDGANGAALVAQARCSNCPRDSAGNGAFQAITLSDNTWTQASDEGNVLFFEVTWTPPAASCAGGGSQVNVKLDGNQVASWIRPSGGGQVTEQTSPRYVFASGSAALHTLTAEVADNCTGSENATVQDLKVDVASAVG